MPIQPKIELTELEMLVHDCEYTFFGFRCVHCDADNPYYRTLRGMIVTDLGNFEGYQTIFTAEKEDQDDEKV